LESLVKPHFWSGRKVFITGHSGFKGGWLSLWLQLLGVEVMGYALDPPSTPNLLAAARVETGMQSVHGDVLDKKKLEQAMRSFAPEIVFHLAAQSLVRLSYDSPLETFATNVMGTANVLECVRRCPSVRAALVVTSDKCYENRQWEWPYREIDPLGGHDPYSSSKACAELVTSSFRSSYFKKSSVAVAAARAGNVIGGGDWARDRLIPDMMRSFSSGQVVRIRHPHALRPWQHVLEPLRGYLALAQALIEHGTPFAEAWNFGPGNDAMKPVEWIADWMAAAWGEDARWERDSAEHPHEARTLTLDSSKAAARLGWRPRLNLPDALALTVDWYKKFFRGEDARLACINQIEAYSSASSS
jgi:CDP-glucose 4,6-dehydratase